MTRLERTFVWAGGAVFVASLGASVYVYLISWAQPSSSHDGAAGALFDVALVTAFAAHHSVFARDGVKRRLAAVVPARLLRSVYVWTASLLLLAVLALWRGVGGDFYDVRGWLALAHAAVQLAGAWLTAQAVAGIDALELAGIRPSVAPTTAPILQTSGPYRWVRHPVYLGWVLATFGAAHMTGNRLLFAVVTTAYLVVAVPWEERSLVRTFGDDYRRYIKRVCWRIVPYLY